MSFFAKKLFRGGGKKEGPAYTPPSSARQTTNNDPDLMQSGATPEALWFSENPDSPAASVSGSAGGSLGLGVGFGSGGHNIASRLEEQERRREQREREQLEAAIRISHEMAQQEEASRAAAAVEAVAGRDFSKGNSLFDGLSMSSGVTPTGSPAGASAGNTLSFAQPYGSGVPVDAGQSSAFSFMQATGDAVQSDEVGGEASWSLKQSIQPIGEAHEPLRQVWSLSIKPTHPSTRQTKHTFISSTPERKSVV